MTALNVIRRRGTPSHLADHAEPCEVRVLLSGMAIYPAPAVLKEAAPIASASQVSPLVVSASDYNGTWNAGGDVTYFFSVKGNNPETGKVKGTFTADVLVGGSTKIKGKISNSDELEGRFHGKLINGPQIVKFKAQLSVELTSSTQFTGTLYIERKGLAPNSFPVTATKV